MFSYIFGLRVRLRRGVTRTLWYLAPFSYSYCTRTCTTVLYSYHTVIQRIFSVRIIFSRTVYVHLLYDRILETPIWSTVSYRSTRTRSGVSTALSNPEIRVLDLVIATSIYRSTLNSRFRYYSVQEMYIAEGPGSSIQRASTKNRVPYSTCKAYSRITEHHQLAPPARVTSSHPHLLASALVENNPVLSKIAKS